MADPLPSGARPPPIGGFLGLESDDAGHTPKPFEGQHRLTFWNARAALAHLLGTLDVRRVWLPAYICRAAADGAAQGNRMVRFYAAGASLAPPGDDLAAGLAAGDAVLGVDYFGVHADRLPDLAARFGDVIWIQDRAQALWPDPAPWGDHLLYSPRKVVGVPDGGVLVSCNVALPPPIWAPDPDQSRLEPARLRAEDPDGLRNDVWFPAYQAAEAAMTCEPRPISGLSQKILDGFDARGALARRRRNARRLLDAVEEHSLFPADRLLAGSPFGVPVLTADAAAVSARMAQHRVFCARHWAELPSPPDDFPEEHALSGRLLTLPCDHRYDEDDMARVAQTFLACL